MTLEDVLYDIDQKLQQRGLPAMDHGTLAEVAHWMQQPDFVQALKSGRVTTDMIVEEALKAMRASGQLPPTHVQPFAEGGLVNDASGVATNRLRGQLQIPSPHDLQAGGRDGS